jgi:hypothetical protein
MIYNEFNESMSSILKLKSRSKPGTYILLKNIYSFFETKENNSSKNLPNVEKKENYINNILIYIKIKLIIFYQNQYFSYFIFNIIKNENKIIF